ncbi:MAG: hypothetical protein ACYC2T_11425 [Bacillota bacterium]
MILGSSSPIYPIWAIMMVTLSLILVPRKDYHVLLPHGILGALITSIFLLLGSQVIKAWKYVDFLPFSVFGIPIFILIAWGATIILFLWAVPGDLPGQTHHLYIGLFSMLGVVLDTLFHNLGLRTFASWYSSWMWFPVVYFNFWINYKIFKFRIERFN